MLLPFHMSSGLLVWGLNLNVIPSRGVNLFTFSEEGSTLCSLSPWFLSYLLLQLKITLFACLFIFFCPLSLRKHKVYGSISHVSLDPCIPSTKNYGTPSETLSKWLLN